MRNLPFILLLFSVCACVNNAPNENAAGEDVIQIKEIVRNNNDLTHHDTIYVPVYSEIYSETQDVLFTQLTVTLSIRNTSLRDTLFLTNIDYYDTSGKLVRKYLEANKTLPLMPMESLDYVLESKDTDGGSGANFILVWASDNHQMNPIFESVMISTEGRQGISFLTRGVSISER